jgi:hypothetical protein
MLEAWLLFDEVAIRRAAGNPKSKNPLNLPTVKSLENLPDPKDILSKILGEASELTGRRLKQFKRDIKEKIILVSDRIDDFSTLRHLEAFQALEEDVKDLIKGNGWD